tara:strand:- start:5716 stop:6654 length:939 start_codon:yes stop_codon:yes gene_type:complete
MSLKILVTGGGGYIGSILVPDLLKAGYHVTVLDNFVYKQSSLNHLCINPNLDIIKSDIRIEETINDYVKKADIIIPLAALVGAPLCSINPVGARTINYDAIISMLKGTSKEQLILMPTTNSAYGTGDENNFCDENSPLKPISQYASEKVEIEEKLMSRGNAVSFRLATVFGMSPRMRLDLLVNDFVNRAIHDKFIVLFESHFKRNYIHVRDVSRAFMFAIEKQDIMSGEIYNVGLSEANLSKKELCDEIKKLIPDFLYLDAPIGKDKDQRNYIVSNQKIEKIGFKTNYSLRDGIIELKKGLTFLRNNNHSNV